MLTSPYDLPSVHKRDLHRIQGRVSEEDWTYFKRLFPFSHGIQDQVIGILFHSLVQELKRNGLDPAKPDDSAWNQFHPTFLVLERLLYGLKWGERDAGPDAGLNPGVPADPSE